MLTLTLCPENDQQDRQTSRNIDTKQDCVSRGHFPGGNVNIIQILIHPSPTSKMWKSKDDVSKGT